MYLYGIAHYAKIQETSVKLYRAILKTAIFKGDLKKFDGFMR